MTLMGMEIGGAETHVLELCKALTKRGLRVYVASNGGAFEPELEACGIVHYKVPLHNRRLDNIISAYYALKKIIRDNDIRLVHAHARIPGFLCGLLQKKLRFRYVTTAHGVYSTDFPLNILSDWGEKSLAVSEDVKAYLMGSYKVPAANIRVTVNGIDTENFAPDISYEALRRDFKLTEGGTRIVSISRLDPDASTAAKLLVEAAPALYRAHPEAEIYIVGGGEEYESIRRRAEAVNEQLNKTVVIMTGSRTDANRWLAMADIFVGSSRSALEALAAGKPVVAVGNAGYLGVLTEDTLPAAMKTNFMYRDCPKSTPEKVLDGLHEIMSLPPEAHAAMGEIGRAFVQRHYSVARMADDALAVYKAVQASPWPAPLEKKYAARVMISGYYGYNNSGDDILLHSIIDNLQAYRNDISVTVLSMRPKETRAQYGVQAVFRFNFLSVFYRLRHTDLLITGGGSVIQDETSTQSLVYYLWVINTARRLGVKNMLYANGIGPIVKPANIKRVRKTLNKVDLITLRDSESLQTMREIGITAPETHVTADAAFALPPADEQTARACLDALGVNGKFFCVAIRSWKTNPPGLERQIAQFADYVIEKYGYKALFMPMRPVEDTEISKRVMSCMQNPSLLMTPTPEDINNIRGVTGFSEFVLGMRLHALIYAVEKGIPVIGLVYDPKIQRLMESMHQRFYMPIESTDAVTLQQYADAIYAGRNTIITEIGEAGAAARKKAALNAQLCAELLQTSLRKTKASPSRSIYP